MIAAEGIATSSGKRPAGAGSAGIAIHMFRIQARIKPVSEQEEDRSIGRNNEAVVKCIAEAACSLEAAAINLSFLIDLPTPPASSSPKFIQPSYTSHYSIYDMTSPILAPSHILPAVLDELTVSNP